ncbi:MAG: glycosyltransferase family 2 protein [bacterium]
MDVSIIIPSWNTRELLRGCLKSIRGNVRGVDCEIIVVDNASSDGSADMVRSEFPEVRLIENSENLFFAKANNQGASIARGKYLLLLNSDTEILPGAVEEMFGFLEKNSQVGGVAPKLLYPDGRLQRFVRSFPSFIALLMQYAGLDARYPRHPVAGRYLMGYWDFDDTREVDQPAASCLMVRRDLYDSLGGFDERFPMFFNDVDLCYRMKRAGWKIYYLHTAEVIHHYSQSVRKEYSKNAAWLVEGEWDYFRKHRGTLYAWLVRRLFLRIDEFLPLGELVREVGEVERILVIRSAPRFLLEGAVGCLRNSFPKAKISLLLLNKMVGESYHFVDEIHIWGDSYSLPGDPGSLSELNGANFDLVVVLYNDYSGFGYRDVEAVAREIGGRRIAINNAGMWAPIKRGSLLVRRFWEVIGLIILRTSSIFLRMGEKSS